MRRTFYTLSILSLVVASGLLVVAATGPTRPSSPTPRPTVEVSPPTREFGNTARSEVVTAKFELHNAHPVEVTCGPVMKGCSCASAELDTTVLPPGGRATLTVTWRLLGKRGPSKESVSVPYTGPTGVNGFALMQLTANVLCPVEPDQRTVRLSPSKLSDSVTFRSPLGRTFRCTAAGAAHPAVTAEVDASGQSVLVTYKPAAAAWNSAVVLVTVCTDQADDPEVVFEVRIDP